MQKKSEMRFYKRLPANKKLPESCQKTKPTADILNSEYQKNPDIVWVFRWRALRDSNPRPFGP